MTSLRPSQRQLSRQWQDVIAEIPDRQRAYVQTRWETEVNSLNRGHGHDVAAFMVLRGISIMSGVAVTALSGIGLSENSAPSSIRWVIFSLGFLVAGAAGFEQLGQYGVHRVLKRKARDDLVHAGVTYFFGGPDGGLADFDGFRDRVEHVIATYNASYDKGIAPQGVDVHKTDDGQPTKKPATSHASGPVVSTGA